MASGAPEDAKRASGVRRFLHAGFEGVEDVVYVALGAVLALTAFAVLIRGGIDLAHGFANGLDTASIIALVDETLLALMIVELLYTVQVSFREHTLVPEPFLLVAMIAAIRRMLVISAEFGAQQKPDETLFRHFLWELGLLTALVLVLVVSLVLLRKRGA